MEVHEDFAIRLKYPSLMVGNPSFLAECPDEGLCSPEVIAGK